MLPEFIPVVAMLGTSRTGRGGDGRWRSGHRGTALRRGYFIRVFGAAHELGRGLGLHRVAVESFA